jgi:hypothetical protein
MPVIAARRCRGSIRQVWVKCKLQWRCIVCTQRERDAGRAAAQMAADQTAQERHRWNRRRGDERSHARDEDALNVLGFAAAGCETFLGYRMQPDRTITTRAAEFFAGPLTLLLRIAGFRSRRFRLAAAASSLLGSLITRIAWIEAGKQSALDSGHAPRSRKSIGE